MAGRRAAVGIGAVALAAASAYQIHQQMHPPPPALAEEAPRFGVGRPATAEEIAAVDLDVRPDGQGLPPGQGTAREGMAIYQEKCLACHGPEGKGAAYDALSGREEGDRFPFADHLGAIPTVGSYWPYATTIFDYVRRAMPRTAPGSLRPDEVYALTAVILYWNELVAEDEVLDATTLPRLEMPARDRFVLDDREGSWRPR